MDYIDINRSAWNTRIETHLQSNFYDLEGFKQGKNSIPNLDKSLLGNVRGKKVLHLQCHFGMDTISLARMGAETTGIDFSEIGINTARTLNEELGNNARFVCCNVYDTPQELHEEFDIVYTSYGVVNWLDNLNKWGDIVFQMLRPGGRFVMVEFHPLLWMLDESFSVMKYPYSRKEPYLTDDVSYTENGADVQCKTITWNYGLSDIVQGLLRNNLRITHFGEHNLSPYNLFGNMKEEHGMFAIEGKEHLFPLLFSLVALKG